MNKIAMQSGYVRLNELFVKAMDIAAHGDKEGTYNILKTLIEDFDGFIDVIYESAGLTDDDISKFSQKDIEDEALIKQAVHSAGQDFVQS